jgi:hypothetical protein
VSNRTGIRERRGAPIVIEVGGIPYSGKTTLVREISGCLQRAGRRYSIIEEYLGEQTFYQAAKMGPDVTFARLLNCLREVVELSYGRDLGVIVIDRGFIDSLVWLDWFEVRGEELEEVRRIANDALSVATRISSKYFFVWLDIDPLTSNLRHAVPGRIVNLPNLIDLRKHYANVVGSIEAVTIIRVRPDKSHAAESAKAILHKAKLLK